MKHKVLDHCIECNQLKRKIEQKANTIRFEAERANREQEQNMMLREAMETAIAVRDESPAKNYFMAINVLEQALKEVEG